jgi:hypothetical protein
LSDGATRLIFQAIEKEMSGHSGGLRSGRIEKTTGSEKSRSRLFAERLKEIASFPTRSETAKGACFWGASFA